MTIHSNESPLIPMIGIPEGAIPLAELRSGEEAVVAALAGGHCLLSRMASLGFTHGAEVTVLQNYGRGPIIARVHEARIALGRGEAGKVYVQRRNR